MSSAPKTPISLVLPKAQHLVDVLRPFCERIELAGSLRRELPTIGDIEIVAIPRPRLDLFGPAKGPRPLEVFLAEQGVELAKNGEKYKQFQYGRHKVDLFLPTADTWGCIFTIQTGSWQFLKWLVTGQAAGGAKPDEMSFDGGHLYAHGRRLATPEEADVFAALGLAYIPPQLRLGPVAEPERVEPVWRFTGGNGFTG